MSEVTLTKPIVAVDIDEVLALFVPALVEFHNGRYDTNLTPESFFSYEFFEVWGGSQVETSAKVYHYEFGCNELLGCS